MVQNKEADARRHPKKHTPDEINQERKFQAFPDRRIHAYSQPHKLPYHLNTTQPSWTDRVSSGYRARIHYFGMVHVKGEEK